MRKEWGKKVLTVTMVGCMMVSMLCACGNVTQAGNGSVDSTEGDAWIAAKTSPDAPYPETVTYTVGVTVQSWVTYPEGSSDTPEDNAKTRLYLNKLNIQSKDYFEAVDDADSKQKISLAVSTGDMPDIMSVDYDTFCELVENDMIEDLTEAYDNCASDLIKEIYASNDNKCLDMATVDGKLYAIPTTRISSGPELLWLRGDWMDKLGLEEPKTLDDIENILNQFVTKNPGGTGNSKNIGLALLPKFWGTYAGGYQANNIFTYFGAYPGQWVADEDGNAVYGSVQSEMKDGLAVLANWYAEGLIDPQIAVRTEDDAKGLIANEQCGAFFSGWWAPYHTVDCYSLNKNAEWRAYAVPVGKDGKVTAYTNDPNQNYFVVRKGYEHPELLIKGKNISLAYNQSSEAFKDTSDVVMEYLDAVNNNYGIDPLGGFDFYNAGQLSYQHITEALTGERDEHDMSIFENTLYESCKKYQEAVDKREIPDTTDWMNYQCRVVGGKLINDTDMKLVDPVFFGTTASMGSKWATLEKMEDEAFLKILTDEESIDYFDEFVSNWMRAGGEDITKEVNEKIADK